MQIPGLIIAGGAASRIGGSKALLPFRDGTMLDAVIERVAPQVSQLALNVPVEGAQAYSDRYPYPLLFDPFNARLGPLAGVIAGLEWAFTLDTEWLATFPCDTPFLPENLVAQLMSNAGHAPVFAHDGQRLHGVCAVWPILCLEELRSGVKSGRLRSMQSAMKALGSETRYVEAAPQAFFNINTRDDLSRAEELALQEQ